MKTLNLIWLSCFLGAVTNIQSDLIDSAVRLGQFVEVDSAVKIGARSKVGNFAKIATRTHIGGNSRVGTFAVIGERCDIADNVILGSFVKVANHAVIGSNSLIDDHSAVGAGAVIGNAAKLGKFTAIGSGAWIGNRTTLDTYSAAGDNAKIADDCVLNKFAAIGENAKLSSKVYVGQHSRVAPSLIVGESAVIHNFVETESGVNITPKQVWIRTPSSFDLYINYASFVPAQTVSSDFNSKMLRMIETELNSLRASCAQGGIGQTRPTSLPEIISLYLMQYHGPQKFNEIEKQIRQLGGIMSISIINSQVFINGKRYVQVENSLLWKIQHEFHFGNGSPNDVLTPNVQQKLIQLLAIDQDAQRYKRVSHDTFCKMLQDILNGDRDVICAQPILKSQSIIFN